MSASESDNSARPTTGTRRSYPDDDVDMDFHVEFPTPGDAVDDDLIWPVNSNFDASSEEKPILVILFGWAGSQHKYLSKYSDIYLKRGCIVLRYICPIKYMFFKTKNMPVVAERLVHLICDLQLTGHPTFVHSFSNGGTFMYSYFLREIARQQKTKEIDLRGTIIDSAPALRTFGPLYWALANIFADLKWFRFIAAGLFIFALQLRILLFYFVYALGFCYRGEVMFNPVDDLPPETERIPFQFWLVRIMALKNHPFTFIYSDADDIIKDTVVERIAGRIKSRGNPVKLMKFQGSEHVQHYRAYPKEYVSCVKGFIRSTMEANSGPTQYWDEWD